MYIGTKDKSPNQTKQKDVRNGANDFLRPNVYLTFYTNDIVPKCMSNSMSIKQCLVSSEAEAHETSTFN